MKVRIISIIYCVCVIFPLLIDVQRYTLQSVFVFQSEYLIIYSEKTTQLSDTPKLEKRQVFGCVKTTYLRI